MKNQFAVAAPVFVAATICMLGSDAFADLVSNGGFELPVVVGSHLNMSSGLNGWTISAGDIDVIGNFWVSQSGNQSLDLDGGQPGTISQTLTTIVNQAYVLRFWMAGNTNAGATIKSMDVTVDATLTSYTFDTTGATQANMGWVEHIYVFTASSTSTLLQFASTSAGTSAGGAALDSITVEEVPEPAAFVLFGAGLGALGLWRQTSKKRKQHAAKA